MTPEREALLDGLGFDWGKEKGQAIFMMMSHKEGIVCFQAAAWPLYS